MRLLKHIYPGSYSDISFCLVFGKLKESVRGYKDTKSHMQGGFSAVIQNDPDESLWNTKYAKNEQQTSK